MFLNQKRPETLNTYTKIHWRIQGYGQNRQTELPFNLIYYFFFDKTMKYNKLHC